MTEVTVCAARVRGLRDVGQATIPGAAGGPAWSQLVDFESDSSRASTQVGTEVRALSHSEGSLTEANINTWGISTALSRKWDGYVRLAQDEAGEYGIPSRVCAEFHRVMRRRRER